MDSNRLVEILATAVAALGGWQFVKYLLNLGSNRRITAAAAFEVERKALVEDYKRVQGEVDELKKQVAKLYKEIDGLKDDRLRLTEENNELKIALKEAEKHTCLQPDDRCLKRLNGNVKCRLVGLLRGAYTEDHPDAILTDGDMMERDKKNGNKDEDSGIPEEPGQGGQP